VWGQCSERRWPSLVHEVLADQHRPRSRGLPCSRRVLSHSIDGFRRVLQAPPLPPGHSWNLLTACRQPVSMAPSKDGKAKGGLAPQQDWIHRFQAKHLVFIPIQVHPRGCEPCGTLASRHLCLHVLLARLAPHCSLNPFPAQRPLAERAT